MFLWLNIERVNKIEMFIIEQSGHRERERCTRNNT